MLNLYQKLLIKTKEKFNVLPINDTKSRYSSIKLRLNTSKSTEKITRNVTKDKKTYYNEWIKKAYGHQVS